MGRKRTPPPPRQGPDDPWHDKLGRLIDARREKRPKTGPNSVPQTDAELAKLAKITPTYLSQMIKGQADATVKTLLDVLRAVDATLCDLDRS